MAERVLVDLQDARLLRSVTRLLEGAGYEVIATTPEADLAFLAAFEDPDFVVVDDLDPGSRGGQGVARLKAGPRKDCAIVILLAEETISQQDTFEFWQRGADTVISRSEHGNLPEVFAFARRVKDDCGDDDDDRGRTII
ncbi:MAG: response regulator transcription factor [Armatimonadetes bacterium]|nr:response regulator transcription factor [Armatimonadota bacterium]